MSNIENNKLIAEFMSGKLTGNSYEIDGLFYPFHKLKFHTSWDWLMPVINKIRSFYNNTEVTGEQCEDIISFLAEGCIEANILQAYEQVVEFIEDFNRVNK
jgi:hypothetical protein